MTHASKGTSQDGFDAEWRVANLLTVEGDLISGYELFDEADLDAALARFDELDRPSAPRLQNAATKARARLADAFNHRDLDGFLALHNGRYEDRRKGLRNEGPVSPEFARAVLFEAPESWRLETEAIALRGDHLGLTRERFRDTDEADRPITVETLMLTEVNDDELISYAVNFDPDDINGAISELTARWIASGEVAHPGIIESADRLSEIVNRHDWDAIAAHFGGATYVNHRQLANAGNDTIADWLSSMRTAPPSRFRTSCSAFSTVIASPISKPSTKTSATWPWPGSRSQPVGLRRVQPGEIPTATAMRFLMLANCCAVIREGVGLMRRSDTLVT